MELPGAFGPYENNNNNNNEEVKYSRPVCCVCELAIMLVIRRILLQTICRSYAKYLKRQAVRVLTSEESEQFHSAQRKSPAAAKSYVNAGIFGSKLPSGVTQDNATFETLHMGDSRFG